ncbi:MAG: guanylate kinase [Rhodocyclaceae bacterium]|jgi:guanylate kinase|nr:MAG: guanylate kinase [Rhodocyclaceae bacterium]
MKGCLFIVAAPSGAGKTTLVRELLARDSAVKLSVSFTTRKPRVGERDGVDYHFVTREQFQCMREQGDFLESAEVHGNLYGTSRVWIEGEMGAGRDILLEIDWQGARQVRAVFGDAVGIFILPPSIEELERRLVGRGLDAADVIARRLSNARNEMKHVGGFDYVIINKELHTAVDELVWVVRAARLRLPVQRAHHPQLFFQLTQSDDED